MTNQAELSRVFTDLDRTLIKGLDDNAWEEVIRQPVPFPTDLMTSLAVAYRLAKDGLLKKYSEEEIIRKKRSLMQLWYESLPTEELLFEDTHSFLTALNEDGHPVYLVTTKHKDLTDFILRRLGLSQYFRATYTGLNSKREDIERYGGKKYFVTDSPRDIENTLGIEHLKHIAVSRDTSYREEDYRRVRPDVVIVRTLTDALYEIRREN